MKKQLLTLAMLLISMATFAQDRPRLVVGIAVDQMRWDYLYRYYEEYGNGGFHRLMNEGFNCENCQINYIPSVTAIGHSSVFTGSVPSIHGIAGNTIERAPLLPSLISRLLDDVFLHLQVLAGQPKPEQ